MIESLPAVNATLNAIAAVLLAVGWVLIKQKRIIAHRNCMIAALVVSALFLSCYLVYHVNHLSTSFPGTGVWRTIYFAVLVPHIILAIVMLPMIFLTFLWAFRGQIDRHRGLARWTLPIWLYVSVTGVVVYVMLYRIPWS
ncbi:hypothetical protein Pan216_39640 [Planctomycetes bacterium Pan216]|uniref:DUF420 domain-containing protein n=1 Tax=Kolteria novifilia TaxID=2527975 RepID=A0A518B7Y6_9BACT|nr:hypothetical protein Pan216_39640 [Planctomycetes bacterium Pan216]